MARAMFSSLSSNLFISGSYKLLEIRLVRGGSNVMMCITNEICLCNIRTMIKYASLVRNLLHCAKKKGSELQLSGEGAE